MVSGRCLAQPVLLDDWSENLNLLASLQGGATKRKIVLAGRPRLRLALYWGAQWLHGAPPTRPSQAQQFGWLYPAWHSQPPVVQLRLAGVTTPRVVPRAALRILARHRVPLWRCGLA